MYFYVLYCSSENCVLLWCNIFINLNLVCNNVITLLLYFKINVFPGLEAMRGTSPLELIFASNDELFSEVKVMENVGKVMLP